MLPLLHFAWKQKANLLFCVSFWLLYETVSIETIFQNQQNGLQIDIPKMFEAINKKSCQC